MANMDYIRRASMSKRNRQFLTSYDWEFEIDFSNYAFYHPGNETLHTQVKEIGNVDPTLTTSLLETTIRGFKIHQPGMTNNYEKASFVLNFADFEDQTIKYWMLDWQNKMDSLTTHVGYRREDLMVDFYVWRLNSSLQKVWEMHYINCLPSQTSYNDPYDGDKKLVGENISMTIQAEMVIPTPLTQPIA